VAEQSVLAPSEAGESALDRFALRASVFEKLCPAVFETRVATCWWIDGIHYAFGGTDISVAVAELALEPLCVLGQSSLVRRAVAPLLRSERAAHL